MAKQQPITGYRAFWLFFKPYRLTFFFTLSLFILADILLAALPIIIGQFTAAITQQPLQLTVIWTFAIVLIIINGLHDILWRAGEYAYRKLVYQRTFEYETHIYRHVINLPYHYFVDNQSGTIGNYIGTLRDEMRDFVFSICFRYSGQVIGILVSLGILTSINIVSGAIFALGLAGMFIVGRYTMRKDNEYNALSTEANAIKNGYMFDSIANFPSIKSFRSAERELRAFTRQQDKAYRVSDKGYFWGTIFWMSMSFFVRHLIWPLLIAVNTWYFVNGNITTAQMVTVISVALVFTNTIWDGVWFVSDLANKKARIDEAARKLQLNSTVRPPSSVTPTFTTHITINHLSFAYPDAPKKTVIDDLSVAIKKNEKIGIVGTSGGGKSTLAKLLLGLYDTPADITVDGVAVKLDELANLISFVPQDTSLFHRTVAENIAYCKEDAHRDDIVRAAKAAHAHEFISQLPNGYDTKIGERGVKLSGGQRQRIAIARALLDDKPLLLLDEATSALDSDSEAAIQKAIDHITTHKTVIAIAHRLSTLQKMDRIITIENGRIIEDGTHAELLEKGGTYATLWAQQSGDYL